MEGRGTTVSPKRSILSLKQLFSQKTVCSQNKTELKKWLMSCVTTQAKDMIMIMFQRTLISLLIRGCPSDHLSQVDKENLSLALSKKSIETRPSGS